MKKIKKLLIIISLFFAVFAVANFVLAAAGPEVGLNYAEGTGLGVSDPRVIAANIIRIVLGFLGIIAVILIIYAGWLYMTAAGEEEKIEKAKKIIIGAIIGLILCLASFAIASFILSRLLEATGGSGGDGSVCEPACSGSAPYCCSSSCSSSPCGNIPPGGGGLGSSCDANPLTTICEVDTSACGAGKYCNATSCTCKTLGLPGAGEPCLTDPLDLVCAAGECASGLSCSSSCICETDNNPGEGESCDAEPTIDGCQALDCSNNLVCSASDNCTCVKTPLIAWVSPTDDTNTPNGAVGNFITIGGKYFGTSTGQVIFMGNPGDGDNRIATFPNQINPLCTDFWQDNQIIVVVPNGAVSGPIEVKDSNNYSDTTDNNRGANINDFLVNNIQRPGICNLDPAIGGLDDAFNVQGTAFNLSPHSVFFGNSSNSVAAKNIANWTNTSVDAAVPNIKDGKSSVFIQTNNINSNNLGFTISNDANNNPVIEYIEPDKGPPGQYITIYGRNFKSYNAQKSSVKFYWVSDLATPILADIDFPEACKNNWWHDTYIIVKVPKVNNLEAYKVEVTNTNDKTSLPVDFTINNETPTPGLCLLNPNNGPVGWPVAANGERFGATQGAGRAQYFNNKDGAISGWTDKKVNSNVPLNSVSGPFRIINNQGYISNSLPFRVGKCSASSECESGEECCSGGSYWSGICRATGTCSQGSPTACGFSWTFSTKAGDCQLGQVKCDIPGAQPPDPNFNCCLPGECNTFNGICDSCPINKPDQCPGDLQCCSSGGCDASGNCSDGEACSSYSLSQCSSSYFCPNSPGKCSTYGGGGTAETGNCDYSCNNFNACKTDLCEYKEAIDKCAKKNQVCGLPKIVDYTVGTFPAKATANCLAYNNQNRWIMAISTSCPDGWTSIFGGRCVENNTTCSACDTGFECAKETASAVDGICVVNKNLCPAGSTCDSSNKCTKNDSASCECCCRIGFDSQDCCSPLKCEGNCGSDLNTDTNTFGRCSGCASVGTTQAEHNNACNCSGTSGKFCLIDASNPSGVCSDCAQISDAAICTGQGDGVCCVDAKNNNACRGGAEPYASGSQAFNYCAYYECNLDSCSSTPVATSILPAYKTLDECNNKCASAPSFGNTCFSAATTTQSCDINKCVGFACINEDGSGPSPSQCGTCCCQPPASPGDPDSCNNLNPLLTCKADQGSCSGASRGLCCGCSKDSECRDANAGCGSDTCCQARPSVIDGGVNPRPDNYPKPYGENICRNSLIQATFDQIMQISSFSNNVIVAGEYGADQCPTGTKYLTAAYRPSVLAKMKFWLAKIPLVNKFFASEAMALTGNYCIVFGTVNGYIKADETTVMEFKLQKVLEAKRKYYVIIKGDTDITDAIHNGVLSQAGVGMKSEDEEIFNGVTFKGKIWYFTTKEETADNNGICLVNSVDINPSGYLFNTAVNDATDDDFNSLDYDTVSDSDKVFTATAYYAANQPVVPIEPDYNWDWEWWIDDKSVVKFKNGENALNNQAAQTLVAQNVKEANTLLHAKATITQDQVSKSSTVGQFKEKSAAIYVFLCANPWPPYKTDGSWEPWQDASGNCTVAAGNCGATNFALYYCRDAGAAGTADDLPAILSDSAVIRGSSATQNILKEFYFFREATPSVTGVNLTVTTNDTIKQGGKVGLVWSPVIGAQKYTVYYGTTATGLTKSVITITPGTAADPFIISNLTNGVKYYFAVTATYDTSAESEYSNITTAIPDDTMPPEIPVGLEGTTSAGKAEITWTANMDDTAIYKIYYGASVDTSGEPIYGASVSLEKSKCSAATGKCEITIGNLTAGTTYHFAVSSLDLKDNESNKTTEIDLTIL